MKHTTVHAQPISIYTYIRSAELVGDREPEDTDSDEEKGGNTEKGITCPYNSEMVFCTRKEQVEGGETRKKRKNEEREWKE